MIWKWVLATNGPHVEFIYTEPFVSQTTKSVAVMKVQCNMQAFIMSDTQLYELLSQAFTYCYSEGTFGAVKRTTRDMHFFILFFLNNWTCLYSNFSCIVSEHKTETRHPKADSSRRKCKISFCFYACFGIAGCWFCSMSEATSHYIYFSQRAAANVFSCTRISSKLESLRFQLWELAHPSCQHSIESVFSLS